MDIRVCATDSEWDQWVTQLISCPSVTNTSAWCSLLHEEGHNLVRYGIFLNQKIVGVFVCLEQRFFGIRFAYSPRSPLIATSGDVGAVTSAIQYFLRTSRYAWWRCEPSAVPPARKGWRRVKAVQPPATLLLDLRQSIDDLLGSMHHKTRYNIRLAERKGLRVQYGKNLDIFWYLSKETGERDGFRLHPRSHYEAVLMSPASEQITVYQGEKAVASAICFCAHGVYTYLFGASSYEARSLMAPYLVQWSAIKRAYELKAQWYDFYGVAPTKKMPEATVVVSSLEYTYDEQAREAGYTRFKVGFGGNIVLTPGTWDVVFRPVLYRWYMIIKRARSLFLSGKSVAEKIYYRGR